MNDRCGLVNRSNPCRCAKKTRGFMQAGYVDPESLLFARERIAVGKQAGADMAESNDARAGQCCDVDHRLWVESLGVAESVGEDESPFRVGVQNLYRLT